MKMRTDDGSIVQACLNGEPEAFGLLVDKYRAGVYAFIYAKIGDFQDAQEVTQDVFLEVYRRCLVSGNMIEVEVYDPSTDTWEKKDDMPLPRTTSTCVANGKIYAVGGTNENSILSITQEYDPATDTWTRKADMPTARNTAITAVNGKIYAIGGIIVSGGEPLSVPTVEEYDPVIPVSVM